MSRRLLPLLLAGSAHVMLSAQEPANANPARLPDDPRAAFSRPIVLGPDDKQVFPDPPAGNKDGLISISQPRHIS